MSSLLNLFRSASRAVSNLIPEQSIIASKKKWNRLGAENPRFYVVSKKGRAIDESAFTETGEENYKDLVRDDELLAKRLGDTSNKKVLEIGCGLGRLTTLFARDFQRAVGIDISDSMVERAKVRAANVPNVEFVATNLSVRCILNFANYRFPM